MTLFDGLDEKYHECGHDNLYMSAKFCKDAYNHLNKVKLHSVTRKGGRGLPTTVLQEEVQNAKEQEKVRGTVLAAELVGDPNCPSLLAVSVYNTKPVHFLTMAAKKICWEEKSREVYDKVMRKMKVIKFLRLNVNDDYNYGMGGADIADQIRGSYRFDHWLQRYKWWHSIFWWGVQVLMVNSYQCYRKYLQDECLEPMSHYQFQAMIARAWMDNAYYADIGKASLGSASDMQSTSSISTTTADSTRKSRISNSSLHPLTGKLKCRLNHSYSHWPSPPEQRILSVV